MKNPILKTQLIIIFLIVISVIGGIATVEAQIPVVTEMIPFPDGPDRQVYVVTIPISTLKQVSNRWDDYVGSTAYGWESQKDGIHRQRGIMEKTISPRKFTVYNEIVTTELGVRLTIWFEQKRKSLVSSKTGDKIDFAIKKYILEFVLNQYRRGIQIQLKDEQSLRKKIEMKLVALHRAQGNPQHAISDLEYNLQTAAIDWAIDEQNLKMQGLLDKLSAIL